MHTYTAFFRTDADYAERTFRAHSLEHALAKARTFHDEHGEDLIFQDYDHGGDGVNAIEIAGPDGETVWRSDDLLRRLAADDLLDALTAATEAAQAVIDSWERGNLASAVRTLDASIPAARAAIAKAKGPAS